MINEGKFGVHEAVSLLSIAMCNKILFTAPGYLTRAVGTAAWYMTLISALIAAILFTLLYILLNRFPGKNIVEIYDMVMGRFVGFIFSLILFITLILYSGIFSREFTDVIKTYNLPKTPPSIIIGTMVAVGAAAVFLGLEAIARTAKLAAYFALFGYLLLIVLSSEYFNLAHILPILGYGIGKTIYTGALRSSAYAEVTLLAVFAGALQGARHIRKAGYTSLLLSAILISGSLLCFSMIFEYTSTVEITAPLYVMVTLIKYGNFVQRLDPLFLMIWVITTVLYISILFYSAVSVFCKIFRIQDRRPAIIPIGVLIFAIAVYPKDFVGVVTQYVQGIRIWANLPFFIMPVTALIVSLMRKKKGEENA